MTKKNKSSDCSNKKKSPVNQSPPIIINPNNFPNNQQQQIINFPINSPVPMNNNLCNKTIPRINNPVTNNFPNNQPQQIINLSNNKAVPMNNNLSNKIMPPLNSGRQINNFMPPQNFSNMQNVNCNGNKSINSVKQETDNCGLSKNSCLDQIGDITRLVTNLSTQGLNTETVNSILEDLNIILENVISEIITNDIAQVGTETFQSVNETRNTVLTLMRTVRTVFVDAVLKNIAVSNDINSLILSLDTFSINEFYSSTLERLNTLLKNIMAAYDALNYFNEEVFNLYYVFEIIKNDLEINYVRYKYKCLKNLLCETLNLLKNIRIIVCNFNIIYTQLNETIYRIIPNVVNKIDRQTIEMMIRSLGGYTLAINQNDVVLQKILNQIMANSLCIIELLLKRLFKKQRSQRNNTNNANNVINN